MNTEKKEFEIHGYKVRVCVEHPNYAISACARVFRISTGKEMSQRLSGVPEYWYTRCCHNNKASTVRVHRMLALAWLPNDNPEVKTTVNHKDGNKLNNSIENLEWVTLAQNNQHGCTLEGNYGEGLYNTELTDEYVHEICKKLVEGYRTIDIAKEYGVSNDIIRKIKAGDTWFHVRNLYEIPHKYRSDFSVATVHWVCNKIAEGVSDQNIAKISNNDKLKVIDVKRIRHKIRYKSITSLYF